MTDNRISIAIAALGGQGGGVLSNWIVNLAEKNGYMAQYTAIAGVAQRTGATIYAIELFPKGEKEPVLALMPVAGDVDIVIASELMEAGRAVNRGIVTPDKTTLITSDHRIFAIGEKEQMGDGRLDSDTVRDAIAEAAKELIMFDMNELVLKSSSVISSVLFGALAGSGALPFSRDQFEETIKKSGRAVESNLAGFKLGFDAAKNKTAAERIPCGREELTVQNDALLSRIETFPEEARAIITYGVHRLVDYQDKEYAETYLDRLDVFRNAQAELITEVARYLALWMGYEDVIRVADLKTRAERSEKIAAEVRAGDKQIWYGYDYFHARYEEFTDILPSGLGGMMERSSFFRKLFSPFFSKGRIIRPKTILGYLSLRFVARLRSMRRASLKYKIEDKRINSWLEKLDKFQTNNSNLAMEIALCPRLIKGYGETHARGIDKFSRIMSFIESKENDSELASKVAELRDAALADSKGSAFESSLINYKAKELVPDDGKIREFKWAGSS